MEQRYLQKSKRLKIDTLLTVFIFIGFIILYASTLAPAVYDGDSGELSAVVNTLGLAHPTGFPLYILSAKLFSFLFRVGDLAYRLNLYSAFLTALSLSVFFILLKNLGIRSLVATAVSIILGFGNSIWSNAGAARVYSLGLLIVSVLFWLFSKWLKTNNKKYIYYYALILGVGFGVHLLTILMIVPLIYTALISKFNIRRLSFLFLIPLIQYIYVPWAYTKNQIVNFGEINSIKGFFLYIFQKDYAYKIANRTEGFVFLKKVAILFGSEFTIFILAIAIFGLIIAWKKNKVLFKIITPIIALNIAILYLYGNSKDLAVLFRYFFTSFFVICIALAFALESILEFFKKSRPGRFVLSFIILLLPIFPLKANFSENNRRNNYIIYDYNSNILKTLENNSIIITEGDTVTGPLWYLQSIGQRQDVIIIDRKILGSDWYIKNLEKKYPTIIDSAILLQKEAPNRLREIIIKNFDKHPVYMSFFDEKFNNNLLTEYQLIPVGITYKLVGKRWNDPASLKEVNEKIWADYNIRSLEKSKQSFFTELHRKDYSIALNNLATFYIDAGFLSEGKKNLERGLEISPELESLINHNLKVIEILEKEKK